MVPWGFTVFYSNFIQKPLIFIPNLLYINQISVIVVNFLLFSTAQPPQKEHIIIVISSVQPAQSIFACKYANIFDCTVLPTNNCNERVELIKLLKRNEFTGPTIILADRGYPSWNVFAHFKNFENTDFLFRVKIKGDRITRDLPDDDIDMDVETIITTNTSYQCKEGYIYVHMKKNMLKNREYTGNTDFVQWDHGMFEKLNFRVN